MKYTLSALTKIATITALAFAASPALANEANHHHSPKQNSAERMGGHDHEKAEHEHGVSDTHADMPKTTGMFLVKKQVDGYDVSFHVMPVKDGMQHGGSHNLMVKVEANGMALTDVVVNSKVFYADKSTDSKVLMKMGDWYMAGYDLGQDGKHGIMVLFKTADGQKHKSSVYYAGGK